MPNVNVTLVSIPFKRESIYQHKPLASDMPYYHACFNSLQTGKHISTPEKSSGNCFPVRFNSLQTGKHISTL